MIVLESCITVNKFPLEVAMLKRMLVGMLMACCLTILPYGKAEAVLGIPDNVPAATVVIPLLEASITGAPNTLWGITNVCSLPTDTVTLHWQIWDVRGTPVSLSGNIVLDPQKAFVSDFKTILTGSSATGQLTDGDFYRGFLTADVVTTGTNQLPTELGYPFASRNCLKGTVYYVRLSEGAANGIPAVHIEGGLSGGLDGLVRGFYRGDDDREEIDNHARVYAEQKTRDLPFVGDSNPFLDNIISRVFLTPALHGKSRIVVWAWGVPDHGSQTPGNVGGPFLTTYRDEKGVTVSTTFQELKRVVNVIEWPGTQNGEVWIEKLPENFNVYAFSFNAAEGSAALTWEVMFESQIIP